MLLPRWPVCALACLCWLTTIGASEISPLVSDNILSVKWNTPAQVHPGSLVEAEVLTSDDIGYVELHLRWWSFNLERVAPGKFRLRYRVPLLPPNALGSWEIELIAHSVDGSAAKRVYHISYRYF
jgi:hypothetical protein